MNKISVMKPLLIIIISILLPISILQAIDNDIRGNIKSITSQVYDFTPTIYKIKGDVSSMTLINGEVDTTYISYQDGQISSTIHRIYYKSEIYSIDSFKYTYSGDTLISRYRSFNMKDSPNYSFKNITKYRYSGDSIIIEDFKCSHFTGNEYELTERAFYIREPSNNNKQVYRIEVKCFIDPDLEPRQPTHYTNYRIFKRDNQILEDITDSNVYRGHKHFVGDHYRSIYTYNKHGDIASDSMYFYKFKAFPITKETPHPYNIKYIPDSKLGLVFEYKYRYDKRGNWIERKSNDDINRRIKRTIKYKE